MGKYILGLLAVIILIGLIFGLALIGSYNGLVAKNQAVDKQWAQVQNVYQRRADLIPNLVQTVAGSANFEKSTLTEITEARASVGRVQMNTADAPSDAAKFAQFEKAQGALSSALSRLLVVSERYPDLKASQNFMELQAQLEGTENRISVERGRFNDVAQDYNTAIKTFPNVLLAGMFGFKEKAYFTAREGSDVPPTVKFDFNKPASTPATSPQPAPAH
jgi:LemA protein